MSHPRHPTLPRQTLIPLEQFYDRFKFAGVQPSGLILVPDGWTAVLDMVRQVTFSPANPVVARILLSRQMEVKRLVVESIAVPPSSFYHVHHDIVHFQAGTTHLVGHLWFLECHSQNLRTAPFPDELPIVRALNTSTHSDIRVRYQKPLAYPVPSTEPRSFPFGFVPLLTSPNAIPQSFVFVSSRLHQLRHLISRWTQLGQDDSCDSVEVEIFSVLFCLCMYVVIAVENRAMFELDEEHWYRGFHEASRHGSAVFGLAGALENWNWLKEHEGTLEDWFGDAVEWWVDENEEDEEGKRVHLQAALAQMKDELFELFGEVEKQHLGIPRAFRVVSRHQT